ncbi:alpha/beta hydrolase [Pontibacter sp. E15-1]|uniref:alpha/beta hydrolase n=1 Tax=Pontibacter sp. E15-1 TaxID=2919918 RepID=UPI001F4F7109|nr:alpha/beta hydrolase [Pontibacter sp. E15-1]MCJ8167362.1 alpha/beta hydrolase [Pontibacter sp. E15-1]
MKTIIKQKNGRMINQKAGWFRLMSLMTIVGFLGLMPSCKINENKDFEPKGPKPEWGPTITDEMLTVIETLDSLTVGPPLTERTAEEARMAPTPADAVKVVIKKKNITVPPSMVDTTGRDIAVDGGMIHLRVYTPKNATGALPGIVYYHGGGWVIAGIDTYDASTRALAEKVGAVVVSVAYRQAPEHMFPTAHEDSFTAYEWVVNNAASVGIDPARIAVAGESAGGNLAAAVSMMAKMRNVQLPIHQLLVYPIAGYDFNTPSYMQYSNAKPLSKPLMKWFFDKYLSTPADAQNPWISLVKAPMSSLQGLPSATVINAEIDPLQSEGQTYAARLKDAGVKVTSKVYKGVTHEFFGMAAVLPQARDAQELAVTELKEAFAK